MAQTLSLQRRTMPALVSADRRAPESVRHFACARQHHPNQRFPGGVPKRAIPSGVITPLGLVGDVQAHPDIHGGLRKAILLIAAETVEDAGGPRISPLLRRAGRKPDHSRSRPSAICASATIFAPAAPCSRSPSRAAPASSLMSTASPSKHEIVRPQVKALRPDIAPLGHERLLRQRHRSRARSSRGI